MSRVSVTVCSVALAGLGFGALPSFAQSANPPGTDLPQPPPGPIKSHLMAVPQMGSRRSTPVVSSAPEASPQPELVVTRVAPPPVAMAATAPPAAPAPTPEPAVPPQVMATPAPPPSPVVVSPPPPPSPPVAAASAAPTAPPATVAPAVTPMASVAFVSQSAEINAAGRAELDRAARAMQRTRAVELRSYAGGTDPIDARKIALARALAVRSYLVDRGVKTRIEVGDFGSTDSGEERVDILVP